MPQLRKLYFCAFIILVLQFSIHLYAGTTGKITGYIFDANTGEPIPGVNILVDNTQLGAVTNQNGQYVILYVPPGTYILKIMMMGYQTEFVQNVHISSDYTTTINAKLNTEILEGDAVVITADRPLIQTDLTSTSAMIPESRISELPAEEMEQLLKLQAGVTVDTKGDIHIRGGRSTEIAYLIDGMPVTDGFDRTQAIEVDNSSIQELQVISGTFNAEYGQAQSGIVNIVTKTGKHKISGSISAYAGDYLSNHNDLFYNIDNINILAEKNIIGQLSGPIPKLDGTFFLTSRITTSDGWLYGKREFAMPVLDDETQGYTTGNSNSHPGYKYYIPMNDANYQNFHGNLSIKR
ncbi:MAG: TonB-dependent receptor [Calditrichaceae bacterium]